MVQSAKRLVIPLAVSQKSQKNKATPKPARPVQTSRSAKKASVIQTRIDPSLREKADLILGRLGLSTPDAIRIFLEQVVLRRGIPFEVRLPEAAPASNDASGCVWSEETERDFQDALDTIDSKFGNALRNLAK